MHTPPPFRAELIEATLQHAVAAAVGSPLVSHERKHAGVALQCSLVERRNASIYCQDPKALGAGK